jgi:hypothetical protein
MKPLMTINAVQRFDRIGNELICSVVTQFSIQGNLRANLRFFDLIFKNLLDKGQPLLHNRPTRSFLRNCG